VKKLPKWFTFFMIVLPILFVWFVVHAATSDNLKEPTDPRLGMVSIPNTLIYKICDGTTLVYSKGGVVVNSPECEPKK